MEDFLVLMQNYAKATEYTSIATNSSGTAMEKFAAYEDSVEAKTKRLTATFQKLASDTIDSGVVSGFLDLSDGLLKVTDSIGIFNIAILATAGILGGKGILMIPQLATFIGGLIQPMLGASAAAGTLAGTMGAALSVMLPVGIIIGAIAAFNKLNVTLEETEENLAKQKEAYDNEKANVQALKQELDDTKKKLEDLNSVGGAKVTKDGEQEKLQAQTEELQRQLDIAKETQRVKGLAAENDAIDALNKKTSSKYQTEVTGTYKGEEIVTPKMVTRTEELQNAINEFKALSQSYDDLSEKQQKLALSSKGNTSEFKNNQKQLDSLSESMNEARSFANTLANKIQTESESLIGATTNGDKLKKTVDNSLNSYNKWISSINDTNNSLDESNKSSEDLTGSVETLSKAYDEAVKKRKELYSGSNYVGNVDINNRPVVTNSDGSYSTTETSFQEKWMGDEENGSYKIIHFTPILPDGTILEGDALNNYVDKILSASDSLKADNPKNGGYGIVYKVDTEVNGKKITEDNLKDAFSLADAWDVQMHELQDKMYGSEGKIKSEIASITTDTAEATKAVSSIFSPDSKENVDNFQTSLKSIGSALKDVSSLSTSDIVDLMQEFSSFDWGSYGVTGVKGVGDLKDALKALALEQYNQATQTLGASDSLKALYDETVKNTNATNSYSGSLNNAIDSISKFNSSITSLDSAYASLKQKQALSIEDISALKAAFGDTAGFDNFINTVSSAKEVTSDVQNAFNSLAGTYLETSGVLDDLDESNKNLITTQLQHIGISNAEEIVTNSLAQKKAILAETGMDVKNATADEIIELINEGNVSDSTKNALANLAAQKLNVNNVALSTSGDIENLITLMSLTNSTTEALQALQMAKEGKVPMSITKPGDMESMIRRAQAEVDAYYKGLGNSQNVKYTGGSKTEQEKEKGKGKSGKSEYSQQLDNIARSVDVAEKSVNKLNDALDKDAPIKKQIDNLKKLISGQKELSSTYTSAANAYKSQYEKSISGLSSKYVKQIESGGSFKIQNFKGESGEKLYNQITTAQKYWDSYNDSLDKSNQTTKDIVDNTEKLKELNIDKILSPFTNKYEKQKGTLDDISQALNFVDDGSIEQLQLYQAGFYAASKSVDNLKKEISALNKEYKDKTDVNYLSRLSDLKEQLNSASSSMKSYKDSIVDAMKQDYEKQTDALKTALDKQVDAIEDAHKKIIDGLNEQLDSYKELIDAKKESLKNTEDEYQYLKSIAEKTKNISDINNRIIELGKAANSGDRTAAAEMKGLQDDLAKAQTDLDDAQHDHKVDLEENALDKAYSDYEKLINGEIDLENKNYENAKTNAQSIYDFKKSQIDKLYATEEDYIQRAAQLTNSSFSSVFANINSILSSYGLSMSSGLSSVLKNTNSSLPTYPNVGIAAGAAYGISKALKPSSFDTGGVVGAPTNSSNWVKSITGEDGLLLAKQGDGVLKPKETNAYIKLGNYAPQLVNLLGGYSNGINPNNYATNNNNSSPVVTVTIPVYGNADSSTVKALDSTANKIANEIMYKLKQY